MVKTKSIDQVVEKWTRNVANAQSDYTAGIENPKADWATETKKAESRYKAGVTQAAAEGRFGKGVDKAGTEKWKKNAMEKGPARWAEGVSQAKDEYQSGMGEVLSTLQSVQLKERGPAGSPQNYERVRQIGDALHNKFKGR